MSTVKTKFDFDAKYGHLTFYDKSKLNREHVRYTYLEDPNHKDPYYWPIVPERDYVHKVTYDSLRRLSGYKFDEVAEKLGLPDLRADYLVATKYEAVYTASAEKAVIAHKKTVNAKIKQTGKTKLKKTDFTDSDVQCVDVDIVLDVCRMLDDLVKRGAVFTASLSDREVHTKWDNVHMLTVEYAVGDSLTGTFSIPGGTWINVVRTSNPAFHFLPFVTA